MNNNKGIKIAILSNFTTKGFEKILKDKCREREITAEYYEGEYDQYSQEILNNKSGLNLFQPEITFLLLDVSKTFGDALNSPYSLKEKERKSLVEEKFREIKKLIEEFSKKTKGNIIFNNFIVPYYSPLGNLEEKQEFGLKEMIEEINQKLRKNFKESSKIWIFDFDAFASKHGKNKITNPKMNYLGDLKINPSLIPNICEEYMGYILPTLSLSKKCLVLDLDNTLWGGIVGEEGLEGIKLDPTNSEGRPFIDFQKKILALYERGIILAINSRNNPEDALEAIRKHPYMVLKEKHFSSIKINWADKATNMKEIANEINIGLDSIVFLDDDKTNRELIRKEIPEVEVPELPEDVVDYPTALEELKGFNTLTITPEDMKKGEIYALQKKRKVLEKSSINLESFLKDLEISIKILKADKFNIKRISQLTQKTNQFNMTTKRYSEEEIKSFANDKAKEVFCINVNDKFGDSGITGAIIIKEDKNAPVWEIDTFLLSCRILGKNIEKAFFSEIIKMAKQKGVKKITGEFINSSKNLPAKDFYKENNFKRSSKDSKNRTWILELENLEYKSPKYIKIANGN